MLTAAVLLAECGGGTQPADTSNKTQLTPLAKHIRPFNKQAEVNYELVVQALYVAYFGRPADPVGLANFESALLADNAPTDVAGLAAAYGTDSTVKSLIDAFGTSTESQTLYGNGTTADFVTAVFNNVLGRPPQASGLSYWTSAIDSGALSQGDAALAIMAGGLSNTTAQGLLDTELINNRLTVASNFTADIANSNAPTSYAGTNAAQAARTMLASVTSSTSPPAFQSTVDSTAASIESTAAPSFPLLAAFKSFGQNGYSIDFDVSGTCTGTESVTANPAVASNFEGTPGYSISTVTEVSLPSCSSTNETEYGTIYYNDNFAPIGISEQDGLYAAATTVPAPLPQYVSVGNSATYATMTKYSDDTMTTVVGQVILSYSVQADGASTTSVLYVASLNSYNNSNQLVSTTQSTYRLTSDAQLILLSLSAQEYSPNAVSLSITPISQTSELTCTQNRGGGTNGVGFYIPTGYAAYTVNNSSAGASEISTLTWGVAYDDSALSSNAYTGSLQALLWAIRTDYAGGSITGYQLGVFTPDFVGQFSESTNQIYNFSYSTADIVSSGVGTNPTAGQYCIVATLEEYESSGQYDIVDWIQFPGIVTFH